MSLRTKSILLIAIIIILDQTFKIWVKTTMVIGEEHQVIGKWFVLHFIENNGMAFGMEFGGKAGKLFLSLFRLVAIVGIGWYIHFLMKQKVSGGLILAISAIMAGAIGNLIDSAFYGLIFTESYFQPATMFAEGGGYSELFHGRVVDMLYFPVLKGSWPDWSPFRPGQSFIFFRPVFNLADSAVTTGVFTIILFQRRFFKDNEEAKP